MEDNIISLHKASANVNNKFFLFDCEATEVSCQSKLNFADAQELHLIC